MAKQQSKSKGGKQGGKQGGKKSGPSLAATLRGGKQQTKLEVKKGQSRKAARKARHPKYVDCVITCGCGNVIHTRSTVAKISVEVCSACHPFFSGQQKFVDTAGRIEKFQRKYNWKDGQVQVQKPKKKKRTRPAPSLEG